MIENYIEYYNTKRLQRKLGVLTPMEKHARYWFVAMKKLPPEIGAETKLILFFRVST